MIFLEPERSSKYRNHIQLLARKVQRPFRNKKDSAFQKLKTLFHEKCKEHGVTQEIIESFMVSFLL